jgi:hypothetical protein
MLIGKSRIVAHIRLKRPFELVSTRLRNPERLDISIG